MSIKTVALNRIIGKVHLDSVTDVKQNSVFARLLFFILCYKYVFCPNQGKSDAGAEWLRNILKDLKRLPIGKYRNQINSRQSTVFMLGRISVEQNITYNVWCYVFGLPCRNCQACRKSLLAN